MRTPQPFRRVLLTDPDGVTPARSFSLACHKGNAAQTQSSQQVGAQTSGVAVSGNNNQANSGNQIVIGNTTDNSSAKPHRNANARGSNAVPTRNDTAATPAIVNASIVNGISGADVQSALAALAAAIQPTGTTTASQTASTDTTKDTTTTGADDATTSAVSLNKWQLAAALASVAGAAYLIFFRKK